MIHTPLDLFPWTFAIAGCLLILAIAAGISTAIVIACVKGALK